MNLEYTTQQIEDFKAYERVRASDKHNMMSDLAMEAVGISTDRYYFVQDNYARIQCFIQTGAEPSDFHTKEYEVTITRTTNKQCVFTVQANSEDEAESKALDKADAYDWRQDDVYDDATFDVEDTIECVTN